MSETKANWFKKHKILTGILIFITLVAIVSALGGGNNNTSTNSGTTDNKLASSSSADSESKKETGIGQPAQDGKFEFIVKSLQCGVESVGDNPYLTKKAQGQYCLLDLTVKNIGNEKQSLFSSNQKLLNGDVEYSADDTATLYASPDSSSWYNDINPGNSVEGKIVFDVPKEVTPTVAELHDSAFSNGVKVSLQ
jgi:hypothetical protein